MPKPKMPRISTALRTELTRPPLLNENEAARILGLSPKTLQRWRVYRRGVRFLKIGGTVRYDPADIADYIDAQRQML
jgi:hypothetical protein